MGILDETSAKYQELSQRSDRCLVAYSGGKDSMVVLDYAVRYFKEVLAFFMYWVPDLELQEKALSEAEKRYGIEIVRYPHWLLSRTKREGHYCNRIDDFPDWSIDDNYEIAMADAGVDFLITGARAADSPTRRRYIGAHKGKKDHVVYPIVNWNKYDVLGYLKMRCLPIPDSSGGTATGVDTSIKSLLWLYQNHKADFDRVAEHFPFIEAVIWKEKFYGQQQSK